jgi:signal transduction histidine kinase/ActR/RegA family two-component response regulator
MRPVDVANQMHGPEDRLRLLSGALRAFSESTTDYEQLLDVIARTLASAVGDGCVVRLLAADGWLNPAAIQLPFEQVAQDAEAIARLRAHVAAPRHLSEQTTARRVIETGEALLVPRLDLESLRPSTAPAVMQAFELIGIHSLLMVALRVRGESIGLLALVRFLPSSPPFSEQDRDMAQALADHAALAMTNARLLQSAVRELAERQRAEAALRKTEERLLQSQKMEAVGRLAGGVAHDFNNVLCIILSYSEMLAEELPSTSTMHADLTAIHHAGRRAAELTQQLLAFSRQQILQPRVVDLNEIVLGLERMLRRLLGEDVELAVLTAERLGKIKVDPGQIEQVILNLAINARDAMPAGGKLTIETLNAVLDDGYAASHVDVTPGPHAMLAVTDTGSGMDPATQARIFEPFFTTKEKGKGTGLGLSTVFGTVRQSGGSITVYSEPGHGTTFKLYFPQTEGDLFEPAPISSSRAARGSETILLVEDDDHVRQLIRAVLRRHGYRVLEAANGGEALLLCEQHQDPIDLVLTDMVMPRMSGPQLVERLQLIRPWMKVMFMSGYTEGSSLRHGVLAPDVVFLQKPITPEPLARAVRKALDSVPPSR